jgi:uncharacterized protein YecT (DUF1311 family)
MRWLNLRAFLLSLSLCLVLSNTCTVTHAAEKSLEECVRLYPKMTSPVEEVTCTSDLEGSRKRLNTAYGALAKTLDTDALHRLERAQKSWLAFRIAQCEYEAGGPPHNTMDSSDMIRCTANLNRARATNLESELQVAPR